MSIVNQPDVMYYDRSLLIKYFVSSYRIVSLIYFIRQHFLQGVKLNMYFGFSVILRTDISIPPLHSW